MEENIMVSVFCLAYNHERYIRDALEGFVMQKTNYKFEVFVHDDASTDGTAGIIQEYAGKYPDIIKPFYQVENQYSKGIRIIPQFLLSLAKGKYLAWCEGDDCWIDPDKLQKQFDFMEAHQNCALCAHRAVWCDHETGRCHIFPTQVTQKHYTTSEIICGSGQIFATSSYFVRRDIYAGIPDRFMTTLIGDWQLMIYSSASGECWCLQDVMSAYNFKAKGSTSVKRYTDMQSSQYSQSYRTAFNQSVLQAIEQVDAYYDHKYAAEFLAWFRYYQYHIHKHHCEQELIQSEEYDEFRLIDRMRKVIKERQDRIVRKPAGEVLPVVMQESFGGHRWSEEEEVMVTIFCLTCNQEDYIRDTMEGFVSQRTSFKFEVLVHDNASVDGTAAIIQEYAERYPDIIKPIYQTEDQEGKGVQITREILLPLAKGKYLAWCEGYDSWIDPDKLQKQYDHMEQDSNCTICIHRVAVCNNEICKCSIIPDSKKWLPEHNYTVEELVIYGRLFVASAFFVRRHIYTEIPKQFAAHALEDWQILLNGAARGECHCFWDIMAVHNAKVKGSPSENRLANQKLRTAYNEVCLNDVKKINALYNYKYDAWLSRDIQYYTYHICKHQGRWDEIQGEEYEEYKLIDRMRKATREKMKGLL